MSITSSEICGEARIALGATKYKWRPDVAALVDRFERRYATKGNTYDDHPTGWNLDEVSVDFWSPRGRGYNIRTEVGNQIHHRLLYRGLEPNFRWIIWYGIIYYPGGAHQRYWDPADLHYDHVHVTFW